MQIFIFNAFLSLNPVIGKLALEKLYRGQKFLDHSMQQKTKKARMSKMSLIVGNRIKIKKWKQTSDCFLPLKQFLTDSFPYLFTACFKIWFVLWQLVLRAHSNSLRVCLGQVVDCRPRGLGFNYCPFQTFFNRTCLPRICLEWVHSEKEREDCETLAMPL